ncbi:HAD family hydrolase [Cryobacterium frigoriphilum]|uniref:HAD family hydrolase n=1 Tax=Cryobacterium frigoriphilum TaxID=1259150 RepID=A0A4V3IQV5_9MICO|nr:HAD-IA family hydrolase [Cryobacterium frigoriphilum]TFD48814.1 HAD family hydrolase [Cryobacterium frigoriphilum]
MPTLIFDCDGVLADTERYGHLPAFNQTFAEFFVPVRWSDADYAQKLLIGGGKERMLSILTPELCHRLGLDPMSPHFTAARAAMIARWHQRKTQIYTERVIAGDLPARPGVFRLASEAAAAGWRLAVASTSAAASVRAVLEHTVGPDLAARFTIFAGDIVAAKKPAPDIYRYALDALGTDNGGLNPDSVVVVEDSANGLRAALGAGLRTLVTVSGYTVDDNFAGAALVVSSLGEPDVLETITLADPFRLRPGAIVDLGVLESILTRTPSADPLLDHASEVEI